MVPAYPLPDTLKAVASSAPRENPFARRQPPIRPILNALTLLPTARTDTIVYILYR